MPTYRVPAVPEPDPPLPSAWDANPGATAYRRERRARQMAGVRKVLVGLWFLLIALLHFLGEARPGR